MAETRSPESYLAEIGQLRTERNRAWQQRRDAEARMYEALERATVWQRVAVTQAAILKRHDLIPRDVSTPADKSDYTREYCGTATIPEDKP